MNAVSIRGDWVGRKIDGRFPLIAWLGGSGSSGVFLTEVADPSEMRVSAEPHRAAIKLIAASAHSEERLAMCTRASSLSHPHLVQILDCGHDEVDGQEVVYVVTELAEEVLAQIIPERPLTADETRDMLGPVLEALDFLHQHEFVHGRLKPSNILVVENAVKLSSDGLLASGKPAHDVFSNDIHNAPELPSGPITAAADSWSLGVALVEALTQELPIWDAATDQEADVPPSLPIPFAQIAGDCLHTDPARRCTLADIRALLDGRTKPDDQEVSKPVLSASPPPRRLAERMLPRKIPLVPLIVGLVLLAAVIVGLEIRSRRANTAPLATAATQPSPPAEPESIGGGQQPPGGGTSPAEIIDRVLPDVPRAASDTIQGRVSVSVRVTVDQTGDVSNAELASRGPSAYFARLALESSRNWKFKPAHHNGQPVPSTWMLHYAFRRGGTEVSPAETEP